jgi:hypothetical protein
MKPAELTKRIEELSEKLKPPSSEGICLDFYSFTEPEQLALLKNIELDEKHSGKWNPDLIQETKDMYCVMQRLGHKSIKNMLLYVQLQEAIFQGETNYISKVAKSEKEICSLVEAGFEYVTEFEDTKYSGIQTLAFVYLPQKTKRHQIYHRNVHRCQKAYHTIR